MRFGVPDPLTLVDELQWLGRFAEHDPGTPLSEVDEPRKRLAGWRFEWDITSYPGAAHGFLQEDRADLYRPDAAEDAWKRTLRWLETHTQEVA